MGHHEVLEWMLSFKSLKGAVHLSDSDLGTPAHDAADNRYVLGTANTLHDILVHAVLLRSRCSVGIVPGDYGCVRVASSKLIWKRMSNLGRVEMSSSHSNAFFASLFG